MKIRYIEPQPKGATIYEIANLPKLGLPLLAACAREWDPSLDQRIFCELIRGVKVDWDDVLSADLVCISTTTNTTLDHSGITGTDEQGGLSGAPLRARATEVLRFVTSRTRLPVIASGGVMDADSALEKLDAGASLVQVYTGFVYRGPALLREIETALLQRLA